MAISELHLNDFNKLFTGNTLNYGRHTYSFNKEGEKEKGGNSLIKDKHLTMTPYKSHLEGKTGLGIIPITEKNECKFAVIDVDIYNKDFKPYLDAIENNNFPLVPFYSKSGGLHIYLFFRQHVKAKEAIKRITQMSRILGITLLVKQVKNEKVEIYPKQTKLAPGQKGSWINIPYFNAEKTKQGLAKNGSMLSLGEAIVHIKNKLTTIEELDDLLKDMPYNDAPPCLQTLSLLNMLGENNGRNNYLFSFGVYLKKKDEDYFEQEVMMINEQLPVPLEQTEIESTILSSLRRKDYTYMCTTAPCVDFCDKKVCQKREYGIGKSGGYFTNLIFGKMTQYNAASPYYEWQVKGQDVSDFKLLRFKNEDEIIKQDVFLRLCFRELHFLPFKMKQVEWFKLVNQALTELVAVSVDHSDDTSPLMRFHNLFLDFLTTRALATTRDQILGKQVLFDVENEKYYFRNKDLLEYLYDYKNFRLFSSAEIHGLLRDIGVRNKVIRSETNKQIRVAEVLQKNIILENMQEDKVFDVEFKSYDDNEQF